MRTFLVCALAFALPPLACGCWQAYCAVETQLNDCLPAAGTPTSSECGGSWKCNSRIAPTQYYEIRCEDGGDAGVTCGCYRNGSFEREISPATWCDPYGRYGDAYERIPDANGACGWSMSTCNV